MSDDPILVVDDNLKIANFLSQQLLPSLGFKTMVAHDGRTALEHIRKHSFSLMILDLQLPDTTGFEVLRKQKREGYSIPTILVTAEGSEHIAAEAFRLGVEDYLSKPIDEESLSAAINRALAESRLRREKARLTNLLKEQVTWLTVLAKVGQSVTSTLELDEVLRRIVEAAVHLTKAEEGFLALLDPDSDQLYLRAIKNIDEEKSKNIRLPVTDSIIGSVVTSQRPFRISKNQESKTIKVSTGYLVQSIIHVPILSKGNTLGVLTVDNQIKAQSFTEKDEALLMSLADYAAVAIENAKLFEQAQQEIAERSRVEAALRESEERYVLAVRGANDGIWDWNLSSNKIYFSPRWKSMLGYSEEEISDSPEEWFSRVHPEDVERLRLEISSHLKGMTSHFENEHRMRHKDGSYRWILTRGLSVWDGEGYAYRMAGSQSDITDRKIAEEKLLHDAFYDVLTGLPNRALFMDRLKSAIERARRRSDYLFAVLFLDLDRFKDINDSLGHMAGDQLLISSANLLRTGLRSSDTIARLGGDEFVILLEDIREPDDAIRIANWIQEKLSTSFHLGEHNVYITISIGIILNTQNYHRAEDVLRDADIAMYVAKAQGKARYEVFVPEMRQRIMDRVALENDLRLAIDRGELQVYYQPIVSLTNSRMIGLEALVRWQHPERGLLQPVDFIPLAEETGLIIPIDRWVMLRACSQLQEWQAQVPTDPPLSISVNLSGKEIGQHDLIEYVQQVLKETNLEPWQLKLEITESAIMENNELTKKILSQLQGLGVQVQIDDFGTGYSSLGYLQNFPVNALKIDRAFVGRLGDNGNSSDIVQTVVILAHDLGMETVAEGVETIGQMDRLKALGCEYGQGYYVSKPLETKHIWELLHEIQKGKQPFPTWKLPVV